ncbi:MAG: hypothetical protein ACHQ51_06475 [Elusimicrobiota bacterium]
MARLTGAVLLSVLALNAAAQSPMPYNSAPAAPPPASAAPAVSTETAVSSSTDTVNVSISTGGVHVAGAVKAKLTRPIRAILHATAKEWEPVSLRAGGDPVMAQCKAVLRQVKVKKKLKGVSSPAKATVRLIKKKDDSWLIVAVFPKGLEKKRAHFEIRFRLFEGYVEDVKVALVTIADPRTGGWMLNAEELRSRGVAFEEDSPATGQILISALDPRPSKTAFNAGQLKMAAFAGEDVGLSDVSWTATGLSAPK